ncbi:MAG: sirohydrochlorin chelatase [Bacillus sp. (in: firmicutes)]
MKAVLFICHGSRVKASCTEAINFIESCKSELNDIPIIEYCFLELASPTIEEGFRRCVERGATEIGVVPFLLLTAVHAIHDIPEELNKVCALYPDVKVSYGTPIGVSPKMSKLLLDKVAETNISPKDAHVVIVGRGSSMLEVKKQLSSIVRAVEDYLPHHSVCYLTACSPSFKESLEEALQSECSAVIVIPYLIFPGILTQSIEETIETLNIGQKQVVVTSTLGTHPNVKYALLDRVAEVV